MKEELKTIHADCIIIGDEDGEHIHIVPKRISFYRGQEPLGYIAHNFMELMDDDNNSVVVESTGVQLSKNLGEKTEELYCSLLASDDRGGSLSLFDENNKLVTFLGRHEG